MAMATRYHARSISLQSRSHPTTLRIEEQLNRLKQWDSSTTTTFGSICSGLSGLEDLYICVEDLLNMPSSAQEILSCIRHERYNDELLDASVKLLDVCSIAREILFQFKEQAKAVQSALRRRKGDSSYKSDVANYVSFRKKMKKDSRKLIAALKQMKASPLPDIEHNLPAAFRVLREVNQISSSAFQSLLLLFSATMPKPKPSKWSLVSKLIQKRVIECEEKESNLNELDMVDAVLTESSSEKMKVSLKRLEALEISTEDLENCLERVFRCLIKTRSSLLNIVSE